MQFFIQHRVGKISLFLEIGNLGTSEVVVPLSRYRAQSDRARSPGGIWVRETGYQALSQAELYPSLGRIKVFNKNLVVQLTTFLYPTPKLNSSISHSFKMPLGNKANLMG